MKHTDFLIVGTGAAGLFCALQIPSDKQVLMITKEDADESDSFLAQGGICVLKSDDDYDSYFEDTMRAGHYENRKESVDIMIRSSQSIIKQLVEYGVDFKRENGEFCYTREGGHSTYFIPRRYYRGRNHKHTSSADERTRKHYHFRTYYHVRFSNGR